MNQALPHIRITQKLAFALSVGLLTSQLCLPLFAQSIFAGVTDIDLKTKSGEEVISFKSDLPFQYEVQTLNPNQVLLRLHNARLSQEVLATNGVLKLKPSKNVKQGVIRVNDASNIEEIVLSGPGLGGKKITVNGADQLRNADDIIQMPMIAEMNRQQPGTLPEAFGMASIAEFKTMSPSDVASTENPTVNIRPAEFDPEYDANQRRRFLEQADQQYQKRYQADTNYEPSGQKQLVYFPSTPSRYQYTQQPTQIVSQPSPQYTPWQNTGANPNFTQSATRIEPTNVLATTVDNGSPYPVVNQTSPITQGNYNVAYPTINRSHAPTQRSVEVYQMLATEAPQASVDTTGIPHLSKIKPTGARNLQLQGIGRTYAPGQPLNNYLPNTNSQYSANSYQAMPVQESYAAAAVADMPTIKAYEPAKAVPNYQQSPMVSNNGIKPLTYTLATSGRTYQMGNPNPISSAARNEAFNTLNYADTATQVREQLPVENVLYDAVNAYKTGNYSLAEEKIEEALEMDANNADIYQALAEVKVKQGQTQAAVTAYEKAMSLKPALKNQRYAELLILADNKVEAMQVLEMLAPNNNQPEINYMLGTLYEESGQMDKAVTYLEKAAGQKPNDLNIQYNLGLAYEYQGNIAKAKTHYQKAAQLNPNDVDVKTALTRVNG